MSTPILNSGDVAILYGDTAKVVDLSNAKALATLTVQGGGQTAALTPVGAESVELVPLTTRMGADAAGYDGDTIESVGDISLTAGALAVVLGGSARGWVLPSVTYETPGETAEQTWATNQVSRVQVMFKPRAQAWQVDTAFPMDNNDSITVPSLDADQKVWLALTTAGTVAAAARTVGVYETTIAAGVAAVAGARGWLLVASPMTAGGE